MRNPVSCRARPIFHVVIVNVRARVHRLVPGHFQARLGGVGLPRLARFFRRLLHVQHGHRYFHRVRQRTVADINRKSVAWFEFVIQRIAPIVHRDLPALNREIVSAPARKRPGQRIPVRVRGRKRCAYLSARSHHLIHLKRSLRLVGNHRGLVRVRRAAADLRPGAIALVVIGLDSHLVTGRLRKPRDRRARPGNRATCIPPSRGSPELHVVAGDRRASGVVRFVPAHRQTCLGRARYLRRPRLEWRLKHVPHPDLHIHRVGILPVAHRHRHIAILFFLLVERDRYRKLTVEYGKQISVGARKRPDQSVLIRVGSLERFTHQSG